VATVSLPLLLREVTGGVRRVEVDGATLAEIIAAMDRLHPGIEARVRDGQRLSPTVAFTVDGKIASRGLATPVRPDSEICLLPSFGGG
jgi:molybdopterin synthase sulfur carrier subunit